MIAVPSGVRVYLACGVTDMRNYAEWLIMRSWQSHPQSKQQLTVHDSPDRSA